MDLEKFFDTVNLSKLIEVSPVIVSDMPELCSFWIIKVGQWHKLRNRRVPNYMHGGVRGQIGNLILFPIFLLDFK
jgi:hypothetical protein